MTEPAVFRKTLEKTEAWLEAVARRMGSADAERGYRALRSVLHALRDRLPVDEEIPGPAVILQQDSTTVVRPGDAFRLDAAGNILIKIAV